MTTLVGTFLQEGNKGPNYKCECCVARAVPPTVIFSIFKPEYVKKKIIENTQGTDL